MQSASFGRRVSSVRAPARYGRESSQSWSERNGYEMAELKTPGPNPLEVALFIDRLSNATPGDFTTWHLSWSEANASLKMNERRTWEAGQRSAWQSFWDSANFEIMKMTWNETWNSDSALTSNATPNTTATRAKNSAEDLVHLLRLARELITPEQFSTLTEQWAAVVSITTLQGAAIKSELAADETLKDTFWKLLPNWTSTVDDLLHVARTFPTLGSAI
jgi:hypothetical protein